MRDAQRVTITAHYDDPKDKHNNSELAKTNNSQHYKEISNATFLTSRQVNSGARLLMTGMSSTNAMIK